MEEKQCWRCKRLIPLTSFGWRVDRSKGRRAACLACEAGTGPRQCATCGEVKDRSEFHFRIKSQGRVQASCKSCQNQLQHEYRLTRYGLTLTGYRDILDTQGGGCAICGGQPRGRKRFHIDHDHSCCPPEQSCGKCVRGLLCDDCNRGLGMFRDSSEYLQNAVNYLDRNCQL